jgi:hypothetical protein
VPIVSTTPMIVTINTNNPHGAFVELGGGTLLNDISVLAFRPASGEVSIPISFIAKGTWK